MRHQTATAGSGISSGLGGVAREMTHRGDHRTRPLTQQAELPGARGLAHRAAPGRVSARLRSRGSRAAAHSILMCAEGSGEGLD